MSDDGTALRAGPGAVPRTGGPRIGLALGSGAARGWAHIGVIRALAEAGIVPNVVTGCSIGALVGGCLAAGRLDDIEAFGLGLTRRRILSLLDLRVHGGGLIGGERLRALLLRDLGDVRIEDLAIPFSCVATEIPSGHEVWLTRGSLVEAIRASYALPGIFDPVVSDGRTLVDGALVNPVPVTLARALGAEVILCVNLNADPRVRGSVVHAHGGPAASQPEHRSRWIPRFGRVADAGAPPAATIRMVRPLTVVLDAFNVAQDRIARSRLAGDPPDLTIAPRLGGIGLFEFHRAAEAIAIGRAAAERAVPDILEMCPGIVRG
jgi:NTE family protein